MILLKLFLSVALVIGFICCFVRIIYDIGYKAGKKANEKGPNANQPGMNFERIDGGMNRNARFTSEQLQGIVDLLYLYSHPLPVGDWDGARDKATMIHYKLKGLESLLSGNPSSEVLVFYKAHQGI